VGGLARVAAFAGTCVRWRPALFLAHWWQQSNCAGSARAQLIARYFSTIACCCPCPFHSPV